MLTYILIFTNLLPLPRKIMPQHLPSNAVTNGAPTINEYNEFVMK